VHATRLYAGWMASRVHTDRLRWWTFVAVTVPPLLLASLGLTHPAEFTAASAGWWTTLHILLGSAVPASWSKPLDFASWQARDYRLVFGALLLVVSSVYFAFAGVHVYWPRGVFTMVAVAVAFGWPTTRQPPMRAPSPRVRALALDGLAKARATPRSCPRQPCSYDLGFNPTISQPIAAESRPRTRLL
jgi:hypothetical protein